jgi:DNA-3-methyladenine glycosylase II
MIDAEHLRAAERRLARRDRRLARLIAANGPCTLGARERDPFHVLCSSIIGQQLSAKAADTIQARIHALVGAAELLLPAQLLAVRAEQLRGVGLSNAKAKWLHALSELTLSGAFSFAALQAMDDEEAIAALDALPGIGRWTAEMFLIFALDRTDIFSLGDAGLRRSLNIIYNKGERLDDEATLAITARWAPHRSIASWHLWRLVDGDIAAWS